jgi:hypothetical protein
MAERYIWYNFDPTVFIRPSGTTILHGHVTVGTDLPSG